MSDNLLGRIADGIERLSRIGGWISAAAIFAILALVSLEMLLRGVFGVSTQISDEISGYLNVTAIYCGLAMALRDGSYVRVEPVFNAFRGWAALAVRWFIVLVGIGYMLVSTGKMLGYIRYSYDSGLVSTSYSQTPLWIPQMAILVGSALLTLQLIAFLLRGGRTVP